MATKKQPVRSKTKAVVKSALDEARGKRKPRQVSKKAPGQFDLGDDRESNIPANIPDTHLDELYHDQAAVEEERARRAGKSKDAQNSYDRAVREGRVYNGQVLNGINDSKGVVLDLLRRKSSEIDSVPVLENDKLKKKLNIFASKQNPLGAGRPQGRLSDKNFAKLVQHSALTFQSVEDLGKLDGADVMRRRMLWHFGMAQEIDALGRLKHTYLEQGRVALVTEHLALAQEAAEKITAKQTNVNVTGDGYTVEHVNVPDDPQEAQRMYQKFLKTKGLVPALGPEVSVENVAIEDQSE